MLEDAKTNALVLSIIGRASAGKSTATKKFESEINVDEIIRLVFNAYELSMEHSFYDMHIDNIMKDSNGNYKLIDLRLWAKLLHYKKF